MIGCPNCGSHLHFDIKQQKLKCDYCDSIFDVEEMDMKIREAKELEDQTNKVLNVYSFVCPQCGGVIYGDRQDLTGFCSYCGTPVELDGRLTKIERPEYIIPFKKSKEDCKKAFLHLTRKSLFLPKEYKDEAHIDSFRGIYMPYSIYKVSHDGKFDLNATGNSYRRGNYIYRKKYTVNGQISGTYTGFEHDVSSTFSNDISESLSPYMNQDKKPFKEGYVAGFYADAKDENAALYEGKARNLSLNLSLNAIEKAMHKKKRSIDLDKGNKLGNHNIISVEAQKGLYPVWFMSYRNKNRVAYAAINGQTGKIVADLPIDFKKFLIASLLLAIPLYFLLDSIIYLMPKQMVILFALCTAAISPLLHSQAKRIMKHDNIDYELEKHEKIDKNKKKRIDSSDIAARIIFGAIFVISFSVCIPSIGFTVAGLLSSLIDFIGWISWVSICCILFIGIIFYNFILDYRILKFYDVSLKGLSSFISILLSLCLTTFVGVMNFASDLYYWACCLFLLASLILYLLHLVINHNNLATRRPVQFNKQGGDDRA